MSSITGQSIQDAPAILDALIDKHNSKLVFTNKNLYPRYDPETDTFSVSPEGNNYYNSGGFSPYYITKPTWSGIESNSPVIMRVLGSVNSYVGPYVEDNTSTDLVDFRDVYIPSIIGSPPSSPTGTTRIGDLVDWCDSYLDLHVIYYQDYGNDNPYTESPGFGITFPSIKEYEGTTIPNSLNIPPTYSFDDAWADVFDTEVPDPYYKSLLRFRSSGNFNRDYHVGTGGICDWAVDSQFNRIYGILSHAESLESEVFPTGGFSGTLDITRFGVRAYSADVRRQLEIEIADVGTLYIPSGGGTTYELTSTSWPSITTDDSAAMTLEITRTWPGVIWPTEYRTRTDGDCVTTQEFHWAAPASGEVQFTSFGVWITI